MCLNNIFIMVDNFFISQTLGNFDQFLGVFPANHLNNYLFKKEFKSLEYVICNTEPLNGKEGHWISLSRYEDNKGRIILEFFDSLAWPVILLHHNIKKTIQNAHFDIFVTNNKMMQHPRSKFCAFFTIGRFLSLLKKTNMIDFLSYFSYDLAENDKLIISYIRMISK